MDLLIMFLIFLVVILVYALVYLVASQSSRRYNTAIVTCSIMMIIGATTIIAAGLACLFDLLKLHILTTDELNLWIMVAITSVVFITLNAIAAMILKKL
jgi:hypothetical protein